MDERAAGKITGTDIVLVCPNCGETVEYHRQHDHYFCLFCRKYVKPTSKAAFENKQKTGALCPDCREPTIRHPGHDHDFCLSCAKYVKPQSTASPSAKKTGGVPCPDCREPTIRHPKKERYFCLSCAKYVKPKSEHNTAGAITGGKKSRRLGGLVKTAVVIVLAMLVLFAAAAGILKLLGVNIF